ncbi:MAG: hypothetical protein JZU59_15330, partial [Chromatium okenii]|nr:hypothetical protein [Chromatium okenii]
MTPCGNALFDVVRNKVWNSTNSSTAYISTAYDSKSATIYGGGYFTATGYAALSTTIGTCFAFIPYVGSFSTYGHVYLGSGGSNTYLQIISTTPNWFYTKNRTLVLSRSTQKAFLSGKDESGSFAYGSATWASGEKTLVVGGANWLGSLWDFYGSIAFIGYSNVAWSIENAQEFTKNPWQIFKPRNRILYFPVSSSSAWTLIVANALQSHTLESTALTQANIIALNNAAQSQTADAANLSQTSVLTVSSA